MTSHRASRVFTIQDADIAIPTVLPEKTSYNLTLGCILHRDKIGWLTSNIWNLAQRSWSKQNDHHVTLINGLYGFLALFILCAASSSVPLLPVNNVIVYPEYRYEIVYSTLALFVFSITAFALELEVLLSPFDPIITLSEAYALLKTLHYNNH